MRLSASERLERWLPYVTMDGWLGDIAREIVAGENAASGIETGTAKSEALSAKHESPTGKAGDALNPTSSQGISHE